MLFAVTTSATVILPATPPATLASDTTVKKELTEGKSVETKVDTFFFLGDCIHTYTFTPSETQWYRFTMENLELHSKAQVPLVMSDIHLDISLKNEYDHKIAEKSALFSGDVEEIEAKLTEGTKYTLEVKVSSIFGLSDELAEGYYKISVKRLEDIGGETSDEAIKKKDSHSITSDIDADEDVDWFYFEAKRGRHYKVTVENINSTNVTLNAYECNDSLNHNKLRHISKISQYSPGTSHPMYLFFDEDTLCYYKISAYDKGGYKVTVSAASDTGGNDISDAEELEIDKDYTFAFEGKDDVDYYYFITDSDEAYYTISASFTANDNINAKLLDENEEEIYSTNTYQYSLKTLKLAPNSLYYFVMDTRSGAVSEYNLSIKKASDSYPDTLKEAKNFRIDVNKTYESTIASKDDVDFVSFKTGSGVAFYTVTVNLEAYGEIVIFDDKGKELMSDRCTYNGPKPLSVESALTPDTVYYLKIKGDKSASYTIEIKEKKDAYSDTLEGASSIEIGKPLKSTIDGANDSDFFLFFTGNERGSYVATSVFSNKCVYKVCIYDLDGNLIVSDKDTYNFDGIASANKVLETNSAYYVEVTSEKIGDYELTVSFVPDPDLDTRAEALPLTINKYLQKDLYSDKDEDWYLIDGLTTPNLTLSFINESCYSLKYKLYNSRDTVIAYDTVSQKGTTKTVSLDPTPHYLVIYYSKGYYTLSATTCTDGHNPISVAAVPTTCTTPGFTAGTQCTVCGMGVEGYKEIPALGHNYVQRTCTRCSAAQPCNPHSLVSIPPYSGTCTVNGYLGDGIWCEYCYTITKQPTVTPPLSHTYGVNGACTVCGAAEPIEAEPIIPENGFADVAQDSKYRKAVDFVTSKGLFNGTRPGFFEPDSPMTRAMMVTVLWRYAGSPEPTVENAFYDVADGQWYTKPILWASENGIVTGMGDGGFSPNSSVTREQLAIILYRFSKENGKSILKSVPLEGIFYDTDDVSDWAIEALMWSVGNGFIAGIEKAGSDIPALEAREAAARGQVAYFFMMLEEKLG